jgi:hypothetical protein
LFNSGEAEVRECVVVGSLTKRFSRLIEIVARYAFDHKS